MLAINISKKYHQYMQISRDFQYQCRPSTNPYRPLVVRVTVIGVTDVYLKQYIAWY